MLSGEAFAIACCATERLDAGSPWRPNPPRENCFELSASGARVSVLAAQLQVSRCAMYQFSADESQLGWFLDFIAWWCSLFDSQDIAIIKTAAAVVIAGILLLIGAFIIKLLSMIVARLFRTGSTPRRSL